MTSFVTFLVSIQKYFPTSYILQPDHFKLATTCRRFDELEANGAGDPVIRYEFDVPRENAKEFEGKLANDSRRLGWMTTDDYLESDWQTEGWPTAELKERLNFDLRDNR